MKCSVDGCEKTGRIVRGLCHSHYELARRRKQIQLRESDPEKRFWSRVERTDQCWNWTGAKASGYGRVLWAGRIEPAHRVSYEMAKGVVPDGLQLDHLCRNRACVNPDHLEAVTAQVNLLRGDGAPAQKARNRYCASGHEFTAENTYWWRGSRCCRACRRAATQRRLSKRQPAQPVTRTGSCRNCGKSFTYWTRNGLGRKTACSDECRTELGRAASREYGRRKRAARG